MSNSPYAAAVGPSGSDEYPPGRTSVLAVLAVVSAILCLPPMGLLAILLGAISLSAIGRSKGRLEGRGAAISGIILGLITTVLWGAIGIGALQASTYYFKSMVPTGDRFVQALAQGDYQAARAEMSTDSAAQITDEQFAWFVEEVEKHTGEIQGVTTSTDALTRAFREFKNKSSGPRTNNSVTVQQHTDHQAAPMILTGDTLDVIMIVIFDKESVYGDNSSGPKIMDVAVLLSETDIFVLRAGGPAAAAAGQMQSGSEITAPAEDPSDPPAPPEIPETETRQEDSDPTS